MPKPLPLLAAALLVLALAFEGWRAWAFYQNLSESRAALLALRRDLDLDSLEASEQEVLDIRERLQAAAAKLDSAAAFARHDPLLIVASAVPGAGKNAAALRQLVQAARESSRTGLLATEVLLAFQRSEGRPGNTSIQNAMEFIQSQQAQMREVRLGLDRMQARADRVPAGLLDPLQQAREDLDLAIAKLRGLVEGYERAYALLPSLLGYEGARSYLVLPQNDTELFPSGGLISSYGVATFERGRLTSIEFEYFVNLFDRWQRLSGGEYIPPPDPLRNYLKRHVSWGLGEAGWYPDFPTTARLASAFVQKGGVRPTDGTIAIDLQFVEALLEFLGPLRVEAYGVTVDAENLSEVTLEQTRTERAVPGAAGKAFLGALGQELLSEIFTAPKSKWVGLLKVLDRMARERHLQMHFWDERLQALGSDYFLDGAIIDAAGDFLMVADTSVQSTKLNLILETALRLDLQLTRQGEALSRVSYEVRNPFPEWREGRNPALVRALMLEGVYGCYLRVYAHAAARLRDVRLEGQTVGAEQVGMELGKMAFGRFFPVLPGETRRIDFLYRTPGVVHNHGDRYEYSLYVQKQAGTRATPLELRLLLPEGAREVEVRVDGKRQSDAALVKTDLRTDRLIKVSFSLD